MYEPRPVPRDASAALRTFLDEELQSIADLLNVKNPLWDDLQFPAAAVNPPGLGSDPGFDTTNGGYLFDASSTELLFFQAQMPHSWKQGTIIKPHVHWQKTTSAAGDVYWQLDYKKAPIAAVMDVAFTTLFNTSTVSGTPDNDTANEHLITSLGDIAMAGNELSDMLVMKLSRIGGNGADTYGADAALIHIEIEYTADKLGEAL